MLGMSLQVTNGYATPFITSFKGDPSMLDTFAANNATLLVSISQVAEALCILLIPYFLKRYGIKVVMLIAMFAWVFRFGFFGLGNPAFPGVTLFMLSCIVYGVAFDFFNVSGGLFVDQKCDVKVRASAQGSVHADDQWSGSIYWNHSCRIGASTITATGQMMAI